MSKSAKKKKATITKQNSEVPTTEQADEQPPELADIDTLLTFNLFYQGQESFQEASISLTVTADTLGNNPASLWQSWQQQILEGMGLSDADNSLLFVAHRLSWERLKDSWQCMLGELNDIKDSLTESKKKTAHTSTKSKKQGDELWSAFQEPYTSPLTEILRQLVCPESHLNFVWDQLSLVRLAVLLVRLKLETISVQIFESDLSQSTRSFSQNETLLWASVAKIYLQSAHEQKRDSLQIRTATPSLDDGNDGQRSTPHDSLPVFESIVDMEVCWFNKKALFCCMKNLKDIYYVDLKRKSHFSISNLPSIPRSLKHVPGTDYLCVLTQQHGRAYGELVLVQVTESQCSIRGLSESITVCSTLLHPECLTTFSDGSVHVLCSDNLSVSDCRFSMHSFDLQNMITNGANQVSLEGSTRKQLWLNIFNKKSFHVTNFECYPGKQLLCLLVRVKHSQHNDDVESALVFCKYAKGTSHHRIIFDDGPLEVVKILREIPQPTKMDSFGDGDGVVTIYLSCCTEDNADGKEGLYKITLDRFVTDYASSALNDIQLDRVSGTNINTLSVMSADAVYCLRLNKAGSDKPSKIALFDRVHKVRKKSSRQKLENRTNKSTIDNIRRPSVQLSVTKHPGNVVDAELASSESDDEQSASENTSFNPFEETDNIAHQTRSAEHIRVVLRCRPMLESELLRGGRPIIDCRQNEVDVAQYAPYIHPKSYKFHHVCGPKSNQREVYNIMAKPLVLKSCEGFNSCILAYGQTGSGKTHSLEGILPDRRKTRGKPQLLHGCGVIPRTIYTVFRRMRQLASQFSVTISHLEIYKEQLCDLLDDYEIWKSDRARRKSAVFLGRRRSSCSTASVQQQDSPKASSVVYGSTMSNSRRQQANSFRRFQTGSPTGSKIDHPLVARVRPSSAPLHGHQSFATFDKVAPSHTKKLRFNDEKVNGLPVSGLTEIQLTDPSDVFDALEYSLAKRKTHETLMNIVSSRSHSVFSIQIRANLKKNHSTKIESVINLADLSGSENIKRSGADKERQAEAAKINCGLLSLGRVIKSLVEGSNYVPYRDSKLTRVLRPSLSGNCISVMALNVSPCDLDIDETVSTMNYAHMAKEIHTNPRQNLTEGNHGDDATTALSETDNSAQKHVIISSGSGTLVSPSWAKSTPIKLSEVKNVHKPLNSRILQSESQMWAYKNFLTPFLAEKGTTVISQQSEPTLTTESAEALWGIFTSFDSRGKGVLFCREIRTLLDSMRDCIFEYAAHQCAITLLPRLKENSKTSLNSKIRNNESINPSLALNNFAETKTNDLSHLASIQKMRRHNYNTAKGFHELDVLHRLPYMLKRWQSIDAVSRLSKELKQNTPSGTTIGNQGDKLHAESVELLTNMSKIYAEKREQFDKVLNECIDGTPICSLMENDVQQLKSVADLAVSLNPDIAKSPRELQLGPGYSMPFIRFLSYMTSAATKRPLFVQIYIRKQNDQLKKTEMDKLPKNFGKSTVSSMSLNRNDGPTRLAGQGNKLMCQATLEQLNEIQERIWGVITANPSTSTRNQDTSQEMLDHLYHLEATTSTTLYSFGGCEAAVRLGLPLTTKLLRMLGALPEEHSDAEEAFTSEHQPTLHLSKSEFSLLTQIIAYERPFGDPDSFVSWALPSQHFLAKAKKHTLGQLQKLTDQTD